MTATIFKNRRLTFILDVIASEAISANDAIFQRELGYSIREIRVLRLIDDVPGSTFVDICAASGLERSLTSRILQRLIGDGLLERRGSDKDARRFHLFTTASGRDLRRRGRVLSDALETVLMQPFSGTERQALFADLEKLGIWVRSEAYRSALEADLAGDMNKDGATGDRP